MTEFRLGQTAEAHVHIDRGLKLFGERKPAAESHVLSEWLERLSLKMLQRETEQVLAGTPGEFDG